MLPPHRRRRQLQLHLRRQARLQVRHRDRLLPRHRDRLQARLQDHLLRRLQARHRDHLQARLQTRLLPLRLARHRCLLLHQPIVPLLSLPQRNLRLCPLLLQPLMETVTFGIAGSPRTAEATGTATLLPA